MTLTILTNKKKSPKNKSKAKKAEGGKRKVLMAMEEYHHTRGKKDSFIIYSGTFRHIVHNSKILRLKVVLLTESSLPTEKF